MYIVCLRCEARLTKELQIVNSSECDDGDGKPYIRPGTTIQESGTVFQQNVGGYVVNVDDAIETRRTESINRLNGCCGLDGLDGPNLLCMACGAEVATEKTDCWMPHCVIFEPAATRMVRVSSE